MKKVVLLLVYSFLWTFCFAENVSVGVFIHYPNVYQATDTKELKGAGIEYITTVLKKMGYTPEFTVLPFARLLSELQDGTIDLSFELMRTPERDKYLLFPDSPALVFKPTLTVRSDSHLTTISSIEDLKGMKIGYLPNSVVPKFLDAPNIVSFDYLGGDDWIQRNLDKLLAGRIDAALDQNPYSFIAAAKQISSMDKIRTLSIPGAGSNAYVVFSRKSKIGTTLLEKYNLLMKKDTTNYDALIKTELAK
jgi:ABC-type amino acid transport/signal transduction systems, periplasmic component/domain